ncbi:MAG: methylated-DNA--[protein]-cysteine S-methyltransferase [Raoultibacter sp.]
MSAHLSTYFIYNTPAGHVTIAASATAITRIVLGKQSLAGTLKATDITNRAANQIQEYLAGKRFAFDLPLDLAGTPFQKHVWEALKTVPYGQTRTCSDIAAAIGKPNSCQAVGAAVNKNPIAIIVASHRIVGAAGKPVGSAGELKTKEFLLGLERNGNL